MERRLDIQELIRLRRFAAFMILQYGPEFGFVLDRIECMIETAQKDDPTVKALRIMAELNDVTPLQSEKRLMLIADHKT